MIDQQIRNNDCGISAVKIVYNILGKSINRDYIKDNIFLDQYGSRMTDLQAFFNANDCEAKFSLLDINTTKGKKVYFKELFPFILPIESDQGLHYVVVNGIKGDKLKIYDSTKVKSYYLKLQELKKIAHFSSSYLDQVAMHERLDVMVGKELFDYNINKNDALKTNSIADLFNKLSYFSYFKENYSFVSEKKEKQFLLDIIHNQDIAMVPEHFNSLHYNKERIKVIAPLILSVKAKDKEPVNSPDYTAEEENMYVKLLRSLKTNRKLWYIYIFTAIFASMITQLAVFINQILIDEVLPSFQINILILFAIGVGVFRFFNLAISMYKRFIRIHLGNILDKYFLGTFDQKLNDFSIRFIQTFRRGDLTERLSDSRKLKSFFLSFFTSILVDVLVSIYSLFILLFLNWQLTGIVLVVMILFYIWFRVMAPILKINEMKRFGIKANLFSLMIEKIEGIQVIKSFKIEGVFSNKVRKSIDDLIDIQTRVKYYSMFNSVVVSVITIVAGLLILTLLSKSAIENQTITLGQIITFLALTSKIFSSLSSILEENLTLQENLVILKRYFDFEESSQVVTQSENAISDIKLESVEFNQVDFEYVPGVPVLTNINITINSGDKIRIEGKNGSGKSTFCKILSLLYSPSHGTIKINDLDSNLYHKSHLRDTILLVTNEDILFNESLRYNITFGKDLPSTAIIKLAKKVDFYDFIVKAPNGLDFNISENGKNLSTGQRKKILLMRALLSTAEIVILDEVLSGIDSTSRIIIEKTLSDMKMTILIISHETIDNITFNKTYELNKGILTLQ